MKTHVQGRTPSTGNTPVNNQTPEPSRGLIMTSAQQFKDRCKQLLKRPMIDRISLLTLEAELLELDQAQQTDSRVQRLYQLALQRFNRTSVFAWDTQANKRCRAFVSHNRITDRVAEPKRARYASSLFDLFVSDGVVPASQSTRAGVPATDTGTLFLNQGQE